jgi:hypothetical protein
MRRDIEREQDRREREAKREAERVEREQQKEAERIEKLRIRLEQKAIKDEQRVKTQHLRDKARRLAKEESSGLPDDADLEEEFLRASQGLPSLYKPREVPIEETDDGEPGCDEKVRK